MPAFLTQTFSDFHKTQNDAILGVLARGNASARFPIPPEQINAWRDQLAPLKAAIEILVDVHPEAGHGWHVLLEYPIPRIGRRIDAVLLMRNIVAVLEFKTGESSGGGGRQQVEDYALLLSYFHEASRERDIVPVLVRQHFRTAETVGVPVARVQATRLAPMNELGKSLEDVCAQLLSGRWQPVPCGSWDNGKFKPIPAIIEAAVALYAGMDVFEIGHSCSSHESLEATTSAIVAAVRGAQQEKEKIICFVTGVPGAGKTLVGLNAVHHSELRGAASFLSGNRPLVRVLKEALIRDVLRQAQKSGQRRTRAQVSREVETFVHNVHQFAEEYFRNRDKPAQHVIVFDEAQRAWNAAQNGRRFERSVSEPEMILEIMGRHSDWAAIIALVGGGQEINRGEAGIGEWGRALSNIGEWKVVAAPSILSGGQDTGQLLFEDTEYDRIFPDESLHLSVSLRAIRSQYISDWVNRILEGNCVAAAEVAKNLGMRPVLTRNINTARTWLRSMCRGTSKMGLVGSAHAARLRADGLETSFDFHRFFEWENWFLDDIEDVRSSSRLEVFATQFEIQGLELDWVGVCWGDDFLWGGNRWISYRFNNKRWIARDSDEKHQFRLNAYRVLLTRARQGLVIYVPRADDRDETRMSNGLDMTAAFLLEAGAQEL